MVELPTSTWFFAAWSRRVCLRLGASQRTSVCRNPRPLLQPAGRSSSRSSSGRATPDFELATLDVFRSTVGAAALGFARRALDETLAHVSDRKIFGQPLKDFQLTQA